MLKFVVVCFVFQLSTAVPTPPEPNPIEEPPTVTGLDSLNFDALTPVDVMIPSEVEKPKKEVESPRKRVRLHSRNSRLSRTREVEILDQKCNDETLKDIMEAAMTTSLSTSKMVISERSARDFGMAFDVICARGHFSYYVEASTYCEVTQLGITCFAYRSSKPGEDDIGDVPPMKKHAKKHEKQH